MENIVVLWLEESLCWDIFQSPSVACRIFHLAWPSILSELSTPLLGLVDTVVVGHFADAEDLAALALAIAAYNPLIAAWFRTM